MVRVSAIERDLPVALSALAARGCASRKSAPGATASDTLPRTHRPRTRGLHDMHAFCPRPGTSLYFPTARGAHRHTGHADCDCGVFGSMFGGNSGKASAVPIAVTDADRSAVSQSIVTALQADPSFAVSIMEAQAAEDAVRRGKRRAAIVLPAGFGEVAKAASMRQGEKATLILNTDPSQSMAWA